MPCTYLLFLFSSEKSSKQMWAKSTGGGETVRNRFNVPMKLFALIMVGAFSYMTFAERDAGTIKSPVHQGGMTYSTQELLHKFGRNKSSKSSRTVTRSSALELTSHPYCSGQSVPRKTEHENDSSHSISVREAFADPLCEHFRCPTHSFCFLGGCVCHPGYLSSTDCENISHPANPWYRALHTFHCFYIS